MTDAHHLIKVYLEEEGKEAQHNIISASLLADLKQVLIEIFKEFKEVFYQQLHALA